MIRRTHITPLAEVNKMINYFLQIRSKVITKNLLRKKTPDYVKKYFTSEILSFTFYKKELDEFFDKIQKENPLNPDDPTVQYGIRIYLAAHKPKKHNGIAAGTPSLVITMCKLIGEGTDVENLPSSESGRPQHPGLIPGHLTVAIESPDKGTLLPDTKEYSPE